MRVELERLRVRAARGRGKVRLSLRDISAASGIPRTTLANYLSGASVIPRDQFGALLSAVGVTNAEAAEWAAAWERAMNDRLAGSDAAGAPEPVAQEHRPDGRVRRTTVAGLAIGVAAAAVAGITVFRLQSDSSPGPDATPQGPAPATEGTAARCWPVTGDRDEPDSGDQPADPGSVTVAVACKVGADHGLPWTGMDRLVDGQPRPLGGFGNSDVCVPVTGDWDGNGITTMGVACRDSLDAR
ncbi:MAG TPA: helix-turn-helix transcriptional regulator [Actinophytocola sp.]|uniref:helix-turn-helix domain-containing protein n=1 Tax=Actinophytocola sp. TaxID=1872138 RepID=UPI002DDDA1A7|nr:helix-turn-helix transcriptional regulator [Actinophytocola sp.]HEV2783375.1 helix-turn-helix transcriptional regulator [Actinophytocola sp.]